MDVDDINSALETLTLIDLYRVQTSLNHLISLVEVWQQPGDIPRANDHKTYVQEFTKCHKSTCTRCTEGQGHGPYWYAYWLEAGTLHKQYIGKKIPSMKPKRRMPVPVSVEVA